MDGNAFEWAEDVLAKVVQLGGLQYSAEMCCRILQLKGSEKKRFLMDFESPMSAIAEHYDIGRDVMVFQLETKLLQVAKTGDNKAIKALQKKIKRREIEKKACSTK